MPQLAERPRTAGGSRWAAIAPSGFGDDERRWHVIARMERYGPASSEDSSEAPFLVAARQHTRIEVSGDRSVPTVVWVLVAAHVGAAAALVATR